MYEKGTAWIHGSDSRPANSRSSWLKPGCAVRARVGDGMKRRTYCIYNETRESFLSLSVDVADTMFTRLKGVIGKVTLRPNEGIWVVPSCGIHTLGVVCPLDLIYLDEDHRVIHLVEHFPTFRLAPFRTQAASVLELPPHTIYSSQTQTGDQLVICVAEEMEHRLKRSPATYDGGKQMEMNGLEPNDRHKTS